MSGPYAEGFLLVVALGMKRVGEQAGKRPQTIFDQVRIQGDLGLLLKMQGLECIRWVSDLGL